MRTLKVTGVIVILLAAYIGAVWGVLKIPNSLSDVLQERTATVSVVTSAFGIIVAILVAMRFFTAIKGQISEFYSKIDHLKVEKMIMDDQMMRALGLGKSPLPSTSAVMRYCAGCVTRERERLARIFAEDRTPEKVAAAILDGSVDNRVFKWNGPEVGLDVPPVPYDEREKKQGAKPEEKERKQ